MPQCQPPLELPVQSGVGSAALLRAQEPAADEDAQRDAGDDQRRHHGDAERELEMPITSRIAPTATVRPNWPQVARPVWISE